MVIDWRELIVGILILEEAIVLRDRHHRLASLAHRVLRRLGALLEDAWVVLDLVLLVVEDFGAGDNGLG